MRSTLALGRGGRGRDDLNLLLDFDDLGLDLGHDLGLDDLLLDDLRHDLLNHLGLRGGAGGQDHAGDDQDAEHERPLLE